MDPKVEVPDEDSDDCESDKSIQKDPPKLKYIRLGNDAKEIMKKHATACLALHPKFICIGTLWGVIHLVDHQGHKIHSARPLPPHSVAVNCLDIDDRGDYVASCSDDGFVRVSGFYKEDSDFEQQTGRLVKAVAIDPHYGRTGKRLITGDEKLILHEKTFLSWKSTVLGDAEGSVQSIKWKGQFVAWSSEMGVRVYDLQNKCSLGFMKWDSKGEVALKDYRCNFAWSGNILLIGWVDKVRVCLIRKRGLKDVATGPMPEYMVEPQCIFTTDFFISGIAPLRSADISSIQIVLLGYAKERDDDGLALRPTLQVVQPTANDYNEVANADELLLREYKQFKASNFQLEHVADENRYYVVSPRDIIVARLYDANDNVEWFLKHEMYERALGAVKQADKYSLQQVGSAYIDYLVEKGEFATAGEYCAKILGKDKKLWEEKVYTLARLQQLKSISAYLPVGDYRLDKQVYEMVLFEYLKTDSLGFLELIKKWDPSLYHVPAVVNTVIEHVIVAGADNTVLLEGLALLYSHDGKYDRALAMYLKLRHPDIFAIIHRHGLYSSVIDVVVELMQLDATQAVALFLDKMSYFPIDTVISKLQSHRQLMYQYLDALETKDTNAARNYHGQLVQLHADLGRDRLLRFLKRSDQYPIQDALRICQERCLHAEVVYLLQRMGRSKQALQIILDKLVDIHQAIDFCKQQDDYELWQDLIAKSLEKPEFITYLLNNIASSVDPAMLVERIQPGCVIPGLKSSLAKMMKDYGLQVSVQEGCKRIQAADNMNLQMRVGAMQTRGYRVDDEATCGACTDPIMHRSLRSSVVMFFCRHSFHADCLQGITDRCPVCHVK